MIEGMVIAFERYLDRSRSVRQKPVVWPWRKINEALDKCSGGERGSLALTCGEDGRQPLIAPGLSASVQIVAPGQQTSPHAHSFWHIYLVKSGSGTLSTDDSSEPRALQTGDIAFVPAWCDHALGNVDGGQALVLLAIQNLPAMADLGCLARRNAAGETVIVYADAPGL
jgi:gentisate 1,2-dioxygenase